MDYRFIVHPNAHWLFSPYVGSPLHKMAVQTLPIGISEMESFEAKNYYCYSTKYLDKLYGREGLLSFGALPSEL